MSRDLLNAYKFQLDMIKHLFLDLEDTIITPVTQGWFNTHLINVQKIQSFIEKFQPDFIHIFSFAIWNKAELDRFNLGTRPMIERALGKTLSTVPTVDDNIIPSAAKVMNLSPEYVSFTDMNEFWSKHEAFRLNVRHAFKSGTTPVEVVLLDDMVINENFHWPDLKITGRILNIDQMEL